MKDPIGELAIIFGLMFALKVMARPNWGWHRMSYILSGVGLSTIGISRQMHSTPLHIIGVVLMLQGPLFFVGIRIIRDLNDPNPLPPAKHRPDADLDPKRSVDFDLKRPLNFLTLLAGLAFSLGVLYITWNLIASDVSSTGAGNHQGVHMSSTGWLVIRYALVLLFTAGQVYLVRLEKVRNHWRFFREIRPVMVLQNIGILILTVAFAFYLKKYFPILDRSWMYHYPILNGQSINVIMLPMFVRFLSLPYAVLLALILPCAAYDEEVSFRKDTEDWKHAIIRSLRFGIVHYFVGIPLFAAIALSLNGFWLTHQYFKGGVDRSTLHHLTYNMVVLTILVIALFMNGFSL